MGERARGIHERAARGHLDARDEHFLHVHHLAVRSRCGRSPSRERRHPRAERGSAAVVAGRTGTTGVSPGDGRVPPRRLLGAPPATRGGGGVDREPQGAALHHVRPRGTSLLASRAETGGVGMDPCLGGHVCLLRAGVHEQAHGDVLPVPRARGRGDLVAATNALIAFLLCPLSVVLLPSHRCRHRRAGGLFADASRRPCRARAVQRAAGMAHPQRHRVRGALHFPDVHSRGHSS